MKEAKIYAGVERERERERESHNLINKQAKKLALLSIYKTGYKYENT